MDDNSSCSRVGRVPLRHVPLRKNATVGVVDGAPRRPLYQYATEEDTENMNSKICTIDSVEINGKFVYTSNGRTSFRKISKYLESIIGDQDNKKLWVIGGFIILNKSLQNNVVLYVLGIFLYLLSIFFSAGWFSFVMILLIK